MSGDAGLPALSSLAVNFVLSDEDGVVEEMPELSDGEDDEDEEQWQCLDEEEEGGADSITCLFCDR